ncbi:glutathione S-transferase T3-like [Capsella rubella]|uniref:glutathione S-transferase T3-like n=1 Tax=Capsella rubella TaxID=81985 RepID=UPI000CD55419|nr:glutathione S-transferase T3-like [Capsella rubella]
MNSSGMNDDDLIKKAHLIYEGDYKKKFTMEHAWRELRYDQKWCSVVASKGDEKNKRRKLDSSSMPCSEDGGDSQAQGESQTQGESQAPQARPQGVKAAKAAAKASAKKSVTSSVTAEGGLERLERMKTMWELKEKDFALKQQEHEFNDKISNKKLLDTILAKSGPLSQIEEDLKTKLISLCFF